MLFYFLFQLIEFLIAKKFSQTYIKPIAELFYCDY